MLDHDSHISSNLVIIQVDCKKKVFYEPSDEKQRTTVQKDIKLWYILLQMGMRKEACIENYVACFPPNL